MARQAATSKGLLRRLRDLRFDQVREPREAAKVNYPMELVLTALVVGVVTAARSLRDVESRTVQIAANPGANLGLTTKIADNTFGHLRSDRADQHGDGRCGQHVVEGRRSHH